MELYGQIIGSISGFMYSKLLIVLLVGGGVLFTVLTKGVQLKYLVESFKVILEPSDSAEGKESISAFQSMMVSTASRVGTGNIAGVSTAICTGGPGAIFWMWLIALLGMATAFLEGTLAQIYKRRGENGACYGGPSYYIESVLKKRWLGVIYAIFMVLTYMVGFNLVASFNVADTFRAYSFFNESVTPWIIGLVLAVLFGLCVNGGGKKISDVCSVLVPIMGALYIVAAVVMIVMNLNLLPGIFSSIFASAFDFQAIFGGFAGSCVMLGVKRGLFSNEAGVGAAATAAASASVSHPVKQGLVQVLSVFLDTIVICTATALLGLASGVAPSAEMAGMAWLQACMKNQFGFAGVVFITIALVLFAFTTLLGNYFYTETALPYILGKTPSKSAVFTQRAIATLIVLFGAVLSLGVVWDTADVLMGCMALINVPVLFLLSKPAVAALDDYAKQKKEGKNPVFKSADIGMTDELDYWK